MLLQIPDVLTPDDVRGHHATLPEAITQDGWPTLDSARGQVIFAAAPFVGAVISWVALGDPVTIV